jgi:hypothetical protein
MRASVIAYWAAKEGSLSEEYEDAWKVLPGTGDEIQGDWVAVAVSDGATESLLARRWAAMLTDEFVVASRAVGDALAFAETACALSARWPSAVESYVAQRESAARPIRWYERPGLEKGAFATLLALNLRINSHSADGTQDASNPALPAVIGEWRSAALGDTCLFHVRDERLQVAFPLSNSSEFGTSPALLGSSGADSQIIMDRVSFADGTVAEGDDFFICTDALAAWFLARTEKGDRPWQFLRDLTESRFAEWVSESRRTDGLHNDDVTLIHLDIW